MIMGNANNKNSMQNGQILIWNTHIYGVQRCHKLPQHPQLNTLPQLVYITISTSFFCSSSHHLMRNLQPPVKRPPLTCRPHGGLICDHSPSIQSVISSDHTIHLLFFLLQIHLDTILFSGSSLRDFPVASTSSLGGIVSRPSMRGQPWGWRTAPGSSGKWVESSLCPHCHLAPGEH